MASERVVRIAYSSLYTCPQIGRESANQILTQQKSRPHSRSSSREKYDSNRNNNFSITSGLSRNCRTARINQAFVSFVRGKIFHLQQKFSNSFSINFKLKITAIPITRLIHVPRCPRSFLTRRQFAYIEWCFFCISAYQAQLSAVAFNYWPMFKLTHLNRRGKRRGREKERSIGKKRKEIGESRDIHHFDTARQTLIEI